VMRPRARSPIEIAAPLGVSRVEAVGHPSARDAQHGRRHSRGLDRPGQGPAPAGLRSRWRRRTHPRCPPRAQPRHRAGDRAVRRGRGSLRSVS
jgi:hypothetical protein